MSSFGERVRETRIARGMTQQELADAIGMKSRSTINKIELGSRNTKLDTATKIARALNADPDYLVFGDEEDRKAEIERLFNLLPDDQQESVLSFLRSMLGPRAEQ